MNTFSTEALCGSWSWNGALQWHAFCHAILFAQSDPYTLNFAPSVILNLAMSVIQDLRVQGLNIWGSGSVLTSGSGPGEGTQHYNFSNELAMQCLWNDCANFTYLTSHLSWSPILLNFQNCTVHVLTKGAIPQCEVPIDMFNKFLYLSGSQTIAIFLNFQNMFLPSAITYEKCPLTFAINSCTLLVLKQIHTSPFLCSLSGTVEGWMLSFRGSPQVTYPQASLHLPILHYSGLDLGGKAI